MTEVLTTRALNRALLARQGLLERWTMPVPHALEQLVGLQAQAPNAPYYGLWSRLARFTQDDLAERLRARTAVRIVLMRSTVHLVWPVTRTHSDPGSRRCSTAGSSRAAPGAARSSAWISTRS